MELLGGGIQLLVESLGPDIIKIFDEKIFEYPYFIDYLVRKFPLEMSKFFPKFISNNWYGLVYYIIESNIDIIRKYPSEVLNFFQTQILSKRQYHALKNLISDGNPMLFSKIEEYRLELKNLFLNKLMNQSKDQIESEWFKENYQILEYSFDFFSSDEIVRIIMKLIEFNIPQRSMEYDDSRWINFCFLTIDWGGRSELFLEFIDDMTRLNYHQPVSDFIKQHRSQVDNFKLVVHDIFGYIPPKLFENYSEKIDLQDPIKVFKHFIKENYNISVVINKFYEKFQDHANEFTEILEEYFNKIDFSIDDHDTKFLIHVFLGTNKKYYPNWNKEIFERVLKQYLSCVPNQKFFNPIPSLYFARNFGLLSKPIKDKVISLLIKYKRFNSIAFNLDINFEGFKDYIDNFLTIVPDSPNESRGLVGILRRIIIKSSFNHNLLIKIREKLRGLPPTFEKAQFLEYLGDSKNAYLCLDKVISDEFILTFKINIYLFYKLYKTEYLVSNKSGNFNLSEVTTDLEEIKEFNDDYFLYFKNEKNAKKFKFHKLYYQARLSFLQGLMLINIESYKESENSFSNAKTVFHKLSKSKIITEEVKDILVVYKNVSNFILLLIPAISNNRNSDVESLNKTLLKEFKSYSKGIKVKNVKIDRVLDNLNKLIFNIEDKKLSIIKFESPTSFCPIRSPTLEKSLLDSNQSIIYKWDRKNNQDHTFEPVIFSRNWKKYYFKLRFREVGDYLNYFIDFTLPKYVGINPEKCKPSEIINDEIIFEFDMNCQPFDGINTFQININKEDICNIPTRLTLEIVHEDSNQIITREMKFRNFINSIDTKYSDTTEHLKRELDKHFYYFRKLSPKIFENVCKILNSVVKKIHFDSDEYQYLNKSADVYWNSLKNDRVNMEKKWFQPVMRDLLIKDFGEKVVKESERARGVVDFEVFGIPIELKVFNDKNIPNKEKVNGIDLLITHLPQSFQYIIHTRCGFLIGYDYRKEKLKDEFKRLSVAERIQIHIEGDKIIFILLFLGNIQKPSSTK